MHLFGSHPNTISWWGDMLFSAGLVTAIVTCIVISVRSRDSHYLSVANATSFLLLCMTMSLGYRTVSHSIEIAGKHK